MADGTEKSVESVLLALKERAKELNCLYGIEELFTRSETSLEEIMEGIVNAIPAGWQFPDVCQARITYDDSVIETSGFVGTEWLQSADIVMQDVVIGKIDVAYTQERPAADEGPFLKEERRLINTIADRLGRRILHERLKSVFEAEKGQKTPGAKWNVIVDLLRRTDAKLLVRIARKMLNHLSWLGIAEATSLLERLNPVAGSEHPDPLLDPNRPLRTRDTTSLMISMTDEIFGIANRLLGEGETLNIIQKWIMEERSDFLVKILEEPGSSMAEISNAISRFHHMGPHGLELPAAREKVFRVSLIRRLLNDEPGFIEIAKQHLQVSDFHELLHRIIYPAGSHGKLGGKGSGLFLASRILSDEAEHNDLLAGIRTPRTWYLTSDCILHFINHNDLEELVEQKYEDIVQVRQEYPYVVHVFKNSALPPEIVNGLSVALDDFGDSPLIVRSSSLLEDRMGASFAGKYKSLFLANRGTKRERLIALMDAIVEVYASTFGPDAIEYRVAHGMIDFHEEMGVMIQEVVGKTVGDYFLPAFAGVGFATNEFRWSHRIRREDGLLRMVPGLGTRAVDRVTNDYPVLISPGQPGLRVNVSLEEKVRYSPKNIDLLNLKTNSFATVETRKLLREAGADYPMLDRLVSRIRDDRLERIGGLGVDPGADDLIITFDGLIDDSPFIEQIREVINTLQMHFRNPVDIEFAHDGNDLYLLQCRMQSHSAASQPAAIPRDIPKENLVFSANRYITNGSVLDITHLVYVDPQKYGELESYQDLLAVGRLIGRLNQILPKRQFVLMGPGRWGSRGDIKLGVSVSYSDINNTAMLIEIARKQKDYMPELSFGTHFFQDLVESSIRYLPLYPDDSGVVFNETFLTESRNILPDLLPEFARFSGLVRVIEVPEVMEGKMLHVLMDGEKDEAVALIADPSAEGVSPVLLPRERHTVQPREDVHWRWRHTNAERLAARLDPVRFGVKALYLFGSTKNATAGPQSDIDLLIHFRGNEGQRRDLTAWLEGWSYCLSEVNYLRTGYKTDGLLDVHIVTDEDIRKKTSYAAKIGAVTDAPRPLAMGKKLRKPKT